MKLFKYLFFLTFFSTLSHGQNSINSAGLESSDGVSNKISYSIGQPFVSNNIYIDSGLHSIYKVEITLDNTPTDVNIELSVYPNPTQNYLNLKLGDLSTKRLKYNLFDSKGNLIKNSIIKQQETNINMIDFSDGVYFLKIQSDTKTYKNFKILKKH